MRYFFDFVFADFSADEVLPAGENHVVFTDFTEESLESPERRFSFVVGNTGKVAGLDDPVERVVVRQNFARLENFGYRICKNFRRKRRDLLLSHILAVDEINFEHLDIGDRLDPEICLDPSFPGQTLSVLHIFVQTDFNSENHNFLL